MIVSESTMIENGTYPSLNSSSFLPSPQPQVLISNDCLEGILRVGQGLLLAATSLSSTPKARHLESSIEVIDSARDGIFSIPFFKMTKSAFNGNFDRFTEISAEKPPQTPYLHHILKKVTDVSEVYLDLVTPILLAASLAGVAPALVTLSTTASAVWLVGTSAQALLSTAEMVDTFQASGNNISQKKLKQAAFNLVKSFSNLALSSLAGGLVIKSKKPYLTAAAFITSGSLVAWDS